MTYIDVIYSGHASSGRQTVAMCLGWPCLSSPGYAETIREAPLGLSQGMRILLEMAESGV